MPRSQWSGSISFGLVNIPVRLFSAVSPKDVRFHLLHDTDHGRIRQKRVCAVDGAEVPPEHLIRGYEWARGQYVSVSAEELDALDPVATHTIDIEAFVDAAEIDPVYFDHQYVLAPEGPAAKPYRLLWEAMQQAKRVALGRLVLRTKQYLVSIRPKETALVLATLYFADELVPLNQIPGLEEAEQVSAVPRELAMAVQLVESLYTSFEPTRYHDEYRERLLQILETKAAGGEALAAPAATPTRSGQVVDLMQALEASIARARPPAAARHPRKKA